MDKDLGILDSSVKHLDKAMNDHKGEVKVIMEKFSSVEHGVTQLQTYHEQNQQNWEFVFKKLDALGEDIAAIKR